MKRLHVLVLALGLVAALAPAPVAASGSASVVVMGRNSDKVAATVTASGGKVISRLELIDGVVAEIDPRTKAALEAHRAIDSVSPNRALTVQGDGYEDGPTSNHNVSTGAARARESGLDGSGVGVALLDTGVAPHPDLEGRVAASADLTSETNFTDTYGHGTFMAGLIAGTGASSGGRFTGVAPGAHIMSVKVSGADGAITLGQVLYGLQLIDSSKEAYNLRVVVLALSSPPVSGPDPLVLAVERLWADGLVVVVAAGNSGPEAGTVTSPGTDPYVLTTGATNENGTGDVADDTISSWSARGPSVYGMDKPDLATPGTSLVSLRAEGSTIDNAHSSARVGAAYFKGSGTSMSSAVLGGAVALLLQAQPSLTPDQVKGRFMASAHAMPGAPAHSAGSGAVDIPAALVSDAPAANAGMPSLPAGAGSPVPADPVPGAKDSSFTWTRAPGGTDLWAGRGWAGRGWAGRGWANADWSGRGWAGRGWAGRGWAGRGWAGSMWSDADWAGRGWAGGTWAGFVD